MELICQSCTMESFQVVGPNEELVYLQRHFLPPSHPGSEKMVEPTSGFPPSPPPPFPRLRGPLPPKPQEVSRWREEAVSRRARRAAGVAGAGPTWGLW